LPVELLYADDLILMAESEESLLDKIIKWKSGLEAKDVKMNTGKTKVMFSCKMKNRVEEKGKWPCGVCKKGVGTNAILCHSSWSQDPNHPGSTPLVIGTAGIEQEVLCNSMPHCQDCWRISLHVVGYRRWQLSERAI